MATLRDSSKFVLTVGVFCLSLASVSGIVTYTHTHTHAVLIDIYGSSYKQTDQL